MGNVIQGRVGLYRTARNSFHREILEPVEQALNELPNLAILHTNDLDDMLAFRPDVIVLAEHQNGYFHKLFPASLVMMIRHGFSTKNSLGSSMRWYDIFCVTSEWVRDEYTSKRWIPQVGFLVSGYPAMDAILSHRSRTVSIFANDGPVLLYAPTGTKSLSSAEVLGNRWLGMLRDRHPNLNVLIKPHPHTPLHNPEWIDMWREMVASDPRAHLVSNTDENVFEYFPMTDILMTDASSVMFFFLAMDRPIILVNNPQRFSDTQFYDDSALEWQWRDMGIEIDNPTQIGQAVDYCLSDPQIQKTRREFYRDRVFGKFTDGRAGHRIAQTIRQLLHPQDAEVQQTKQIWKSIAKRARSIKN